MAETRDTPALAVDQVSHSFGRRLALDHVSLTVPQGRFVALLGPNGAGKTTLIKLLTGEIRPDSGTVKLGTNLEIASLDQKRAALAPTTTLRDALTGGGSDTVMVGGTPKHVMGYLKDFLFSPEQANTPLSVLSGGERGRLMLARALALPSNVLVLDEPTNDLDLETLDLLQEMVADYPGTVILVSHDRDFLDRTVTSVIMAEGAGVFREYAGGYSDMLTQRGRGVEAKAKASPPATKTDPSAKGEAAKPQARKRLSFHEQHALKTLPETMEKLKKELEKLAAALADPQLYARDPAKFEATSAALAKTQGQLDAAEEEWLRLEILREELEG